MGARQCREEKAAAGVAERGSALRVTLQELNFVCFFSDRRVCGYRERYRWTVTGERGDPERKEAGDGEGGDDVHLFLTSQNNKV